MYTHELIEDVLKNADIVTVISSYLNVIQKGRSYLAICPFHDDKNPSLNISKEKQIYKCFACGAGGNAISFVANYEHVPFDEAVRKVAEISNYHDPRLQSERTVVEVDPTKEPLYKALADLSSYYQYALTISEGQQARDYLRKRNIPEAQIEKFLLGYAPLDGKATIAYLQAKGHSLKTIEDIGVAFAQLEGTSDRNAGRLIFPLEDPSGKIVGFSARKLFSGDEAPKYVNSPETRVFHKGETLYNYSRASSFARHEGYVYLLEGFMDVMALDRCQIPSAVALCGTSLTKEQVELLRKLRCEVRVCLDGDAPGQIGMMKILTLLQKERLPFRLVSNPGDERDPDDILQESGEGALKEAMSHLVDPSDFALSFYLNTKKLETVEEREKVLRKFLPYCASLPPGIERENYLVKLSKATRFEPEAVRSLLPKAQSLGQEAPLEQAPVYKNKRKEERLPKTRLYRAEQTVLYYMLRHQEAIDYFESKIGDFYYQINNDLANYIIDYSSSHPGQIQPSQLIGLIQSAGGEEAKTLEGALFSIYEDKATPSFTPRMLEVCKRTIEEEKGQLRIDQEAKQAFASLDKNAQKEFLSALAAKKRESWKGK
ncbi:MAG TPA: DNA primase [Firmicutes bacterium]|nr:DNA primase [Bacillota bacterium]